MSHQSAKYTAPSGPTAVSTGRKLRSVVVTIAPVSTVLNVDPSVTKRDACIRLVSAIRDQLSLVPGQLPLLVDDGGHREPRGISFMGHLREVAVGVRPRERPVLRPVLDVPSSAHPVEPAAVA